MRRFVRSSIVVAGAAVAAAFTGVALRAGDDEAEDAKLAKEALDKSVEHGKELFHSAQLARKTCASCHENPDKPNLALGSGPMDLNYPKYSRKQRAVVSLGQKINEMLASKAVGKAMDLNGADSVALEAYVMSLKKK